METGASRPALDLDFEVYGVRPSETRTFHRLQDRRARCWARLWTFYRLRNDGPVPLICPTCQCFSRHRPKHPCQRLRATLHGVVFDISSWEREPRRPCGAMMIVEWHAEPWRRSAAG